MHITCCCILFLLNLAAVTTIMVDNNNLPPSFMLENHFIIIDKKNSSVIKQLIFKIWFTTFDCLTPNFSEDRLTCVKFLESFYIDVNPLYAVTYVL